MDLNFEQMLAQHNQEFREAEVYSNWMPPDGEYIVTLIKLDKGTSNKNGENLVWWNLKGRIEDVQDEKLNGKEFTVGYYTSKVFGILKGAVKTLAGDIINDLADAHVVLENSIGQIVRVKIDTTFNKKHQKDFTNCYIQEVINTTTSTVEGGTELQTITAEDVGSVEEVLEPPVEAPPVVS